MDRQAGKTTWLLILFLLSAATVLLTWHGSGEGEPASPEAVFSELIYPRTWESDEMASRMGFFHSVWGIVEGVYPQIDGTLDEDDLAWKQVKAVYEPVVSDETLLETGFLFRVEEMLSLLDDPLTGLDAGTIEDVYMTLPVSVRYEEGRLLLDRYSGVLRSAPDYVELLERGDRLVRIDALLAEPLFVNLRADSGYGALTERPERFVPHLFAVYYDRRLRTRPPQQSSLTFEKRNGVRYTIWLDWVDGQGLRGFAGVLIEPAGDEAFRAQWLEEQNILFIRPGRFSQDRIAQWQSALATHPQARGMILDLRGQDPGPGYATFSQVVIGTLITEDTTTGRINQRNSPLKRRLQGDDEAGTEDFWSLRPWVVRPAEQRFDRPVMVLTDDDVLVPPTELVWGLSRLDQVVVIGRSWSGVHRSGRIAVSTPFSDWGFGVTTALWESLGPDGQVETAFLPDVYVPLTDAELRGQGDPVMETALRWWDGQSP